MAVIEVEIGPGSMPGTFRVEVIDSPAGHPRVTTQLDAGALMARRGVLQLEVLASAAIARGMPETERLLRDTGQALFAALLGAGGIARCYQASAALAAERGEELRVVLRIDDPALAGLPWEAMYDQEAGAYVCRRDQLVRHVPVISAAAPLQVRPPLRILGVAASPRGLHRLDVAREKEQLDRALAGLSGQGLAEVRWAPEATFAGLHETLMDGEWHVLHYVGHGDFDPCADEGVLALEREDGSADLVSASRLVDLLRQARPVPRLVVLNSCLGATAGAGDLFSGTAAALVRGGITAVTAMQYKISDGAAIAFARGFYAAIARGRGVDDAVSSGRVAILGVSDRTLEWVTPVLYLRGRDTRLFTLPAPEDRERGDTGTADTGSTREDQPGNTSSPGAAGHRRQESSPAGPTSARARQSRAAQADPGHPPAAPGPSRLARTLPCHDIVRSVAFSPDGRLLATGGEDRTALLWDVAAGAPVRSLRGHRREVKGMAFSPDGRLLATASGDQTGRLWDVATGDCLRTLGGMVQRVTFCVAFSPDGTLLATGSGDRTALLWDVATGDCLRTLTGHTETIWGVAFSPDGRLLATSSTDKTARLWDVATGAPVRTLTGHAKYVHEVVFNPDGTLLATASEDQTAGLWDVATGRCLRMLTGHDMAVADVAFSPDGRLLATASFKTVRLWR